MMIIFLLLEMIVISSGFNIIKIYDPIYRAPFVVFQIEVQDANNVFIAGSWNNWANNNNGDVTDPKFAFQATSGNNYIRNELLIPGQYSFKIVIDNNNWIAVNDFPKDSDGNTLMYVSNGGISKQPIIISTPHWSFNDLPFSNGFSASKFNILSKQIDTLTNHIYKQQNENTITQSLINSVDFSFSSQGNNSTLKWLSYLTINLSGISYVSNGGIVQVIFEDEDTNDTITAWFFSSFLENHGNLHVVLKSPSQNYKFTSQITWNPQVHVSSKGNGVYQSDMGLIYVTEIKDNFYYGFSIDIAQNITIPLSPSIVLQNELNWWSQWHKSTTFPASLETVEQRNLYIQSLSILKMSQCRETTDNSYGQILASLPPGEWNICWIRDASYAINGLVLGGHLQEAKDGLNFFLNAKVGNYVHWTIDNYDYGVGLPYQISVCRYYGDGTEWSDGGNDPNIELDGFGLFLWALDQYVNKSQDITFLKQYWETKIKPQIANVIVSAAHNSYNVIQKDSSIWERHLITSGENGAKHFTYTTIMAIQGLKSVLNLANLLNDQTVTSLYVQTINQLTTGLLQNQIDNQLMIIRDSIENTQENKYIDASVVEAFNFGIIDAQTHGTLITNTLSAFDKLLGMKNRPYGYQRNLDGSSYDSQEWIVMDLRIARSLKKLNQISKSNALINWVVDQASYNFYLMSELYDVTLANYDGAVPMCGFGPGAFIIYFWDI